MGDYLPNSGTQAVVAAQLLSPHSGC